MECSVDGCPKPVLAKGFCSRHYQRQHRTGDAGPVGLKRLPDKSPCIVEDCGNPNVAKGYCEMHRWRVRTYGDPGPAGQVKGHRRRQPAECAAEDCDRQASARGYCRMHYERLRRGLDLGPGGPLIAAKGTGTITKEGYRRVRTAAGRRVLEHVAVMEQHLGRRLVPGENVHHKHGMRSENKIEDLELWFKMQPSGQRVTDLMEYIATYHADAMAEILARRQERL